MGNEELAGERHYPERPHGIRVIHTAHGRRTQQPRERPLQLVHGHVFGRCELHGCGLPALQYVDLA
jgi:hypothetical protein